MPDFDPAERCVRCGWWLDGTANDPVQPPREPEFGCSYGASKDDRCPFHWMEQYSDDPRDWPEGGRQPYAEYLADLAAEEQQ